MRIVLIAYYYEPVISPRSFRWTAIARRWAAQGHAVEIVTAWHPSLPRFERMDGVSVHRVGGAISETMRTLVFGSAGAGAPREVERDPGDKRRSGASGRVSAILKAVHDLTWRRLYWPDHACLWLFPALWKARALLEGCEAMITVSHPFTPHLVGLVLNRQHLDIPWLLDVGDPFCYLNQTPLNNLRFYDRLNFRCEQSIFRRTNAITVTTAGAKAKYASLFPEASAKLRVIPPLLSIPGDGSPPQAIFPAGQQRLRLVFVGTLYRGVRNPAFLLRLFATLCEQDPKGLLELHLIGSIHDCAEYFAPYKHLVDKRLFLHGVVDRRTALGAMQSADVLVNIGNDTTYQVPSKLVEYVSTGKPIVNLAVSGEDSSLEFLSQYPNVRNVLQSRELTAEVVDEVFRFVEERRSATGGAVIEEFLAGFRTPAIADAYWSILADLTAERGTCPGWAEGLSRQSS
jgi:glycosyltransferase involved in cell wall biosynthesis